jgi:PAS domain S-box-containing protein
MMPRLDGFGLLRELRDDEGTREIPVIMLSARAGEESKIEGLEVGANEYLVKPFSARELLARVEAILQVQRVRRESQESLRASERKFSSACNQSPLPMVITSLDDERLAEVNESFVRLSGYTREEALGRTSQELRLLAEWKLRDEGLRRLRAGERFYSFEARFLTRSGEEHVGLIRSSLIEIDSRPHVLNSFTDLTERMQAEDAMSRLSAIVESSDDAIYSMYMNGVIRSWNKGAEKLFGYAAEEVIGKPILMLIPPDRADEETRVLKSVQRGEKIDHYETARRRKDGAPVEISLTVSPLRDEAGKVIGASKIARDISERIWVEQALAEGEREQRALYQLADHLHRAQSLNDVYSAALDAMLSALRCDRASILLFDDAGVMRFVGWRGLSDRYRETVEGHSPWNPDENIRSRFALTMSTWLK